MYTCDMAVKKTHIKPEDMFALLVQSICVIQLFLIDTFYCASSRNVPHRREQLSLWISNSL